MRPRYRWLVVLGLAVVLPACGRKAPPLPPQIIRPDATRDLSVEQLGREAVLAWSYPATTSAGGPMPDLERIEVWRVTLPLAQEPPPPTSARDRQLRTSLIENQGQVIVELTPDDIEAATRGPRLVVVDDLEQWFRVARPDLGDSVVWYAVRSVCCGDRESDLSNIARLVPRMPPQPPTDLSAEAGPEGIRLTWVLPDPELEALVERSGGDGSWVEISPQPMSATELLDRTAEQGRVWRYRVRSARTDAAGGRVVGPPSPPVEVDHEDRYPPPPPEELVCLPEGSLVRLRWSSVDGAVGYRIVRSAVDGTQAVLADVVRDPSLEDHDPPDGQLTYTVEAVDEAGNRSRPVSCSAVAGVAP
jgi:hypothetical protein